ncbi:MAG TPA: ABC transporter ATP-binding protein [Candidatus Acidoferrales bacterium]|nr:ABC transporter ATP-binding protein [Candidatus Acidoferrales bacterium]
MVRLENLTKEYDLPVKGNPALAVAADRLNLTIGDGEIFGFVGPNGAGKTTTLKMICGLLTPTSGNVEVNGIDVERRPEDAQRFLGYLSDFFSLYDDLKVWEYLDYFAHAYKMPAAQIRGRVTEVIGWVGLETKRDAFIQGLSRGMKQRLGIARAVLHDPPVIVLDEPASGLDPKARVELKDLLKNLNRKGKTILISSHVLADLEEICTSVAILEKGHLLRAGKLADVMQEGAAPAHRRLRIRVAAPGDELLAWLSVRDGVMDAHPSASVIAGSSSVEFHFAGNDSDLAALVRDLVTSGAPVCAVEGSSESFEQIYARLSGGEVM